MNIKPVAFLAMLSLSTSACASDRSPTEESRIVHEDTWTQQEADAITEKCNAPTRWLTVVNGELQFKPDADGNYEVSVCILEALKASGKLKKVGFVGNQAIRDDEGQ